MSRSNIDIVGNTIQGQNVGTGEGQIFKDKVLGNTLQFYSLKQGANVTIIQDGNNIIISAATGGGGGDGTFISLTDTPANYTGSANCYIKVNSSANALEFVNPPSGAPAGSDGSIQYNNNGVFSGATMYYDNSTETFILGAEGTGAANANVYFTYQNDGCYVTDSFCFADMGFYDGENYRSFLLMGVKDRAGFICSSVHGESIIIDSQYVINLCGALGVNISGSSTNLSTTCVGFYSTVPKVKPTVTGSRGSNAALESLLTALSSLGLVTNSTT